MLYSESSHQPVKIKLKGKWVLRSENKDIKVSKSDDKYTVIKFNCIDAKSLNAILKKL